MELDELVETFPTLSLEDECESSELVDESELRDLLLNDSEERELDEECPRLDEELLDEESILELLVEELVLNELFVLTTVLELVESIDVELDELCGEHVTNSVDGYAAKVPSHVRDPDNPLLLTALKVIEPEPLLCPIATKFIYKSSL